jgi:transcriptional regulator with XRE-family HTH domain
MTKMQFSSWLENKFLDWQRSQGGRRPARKFAEWLGFEEATVNQWLNGHRRPSRGNVYLLALKLGLEIYDVLEMPRPDEGLYQVDVHWHMLKDEEKAAINKIVQRTVQKRLGFVPNYFVERRDPDRSDPSIGRRATDKGNGRD